MCSSSGGQNCILQPTVSSHLLVAVPWGRPPIGVEAWNKLSVKQILCIKLVNTKINILRCTVSKTSKNSVESHRLKNVVESVLRHRMVLRAKLPPHLLVWRRGLTLSWCGSYSRYHRFESWPTTSVVWKKGFVVPCGPTGKHRVVF